MAETIDFIGSHRARLGESPIWDPDLNALFWVDAVAAEIIRHDLQTGAEAVFSAPDMVGCIALGPVGSLFAGIKDRVYRFDLASGGFEEVLHFADQPPEVRLNDGKTDRQGRLLIGSMGPPYGEKMMGRLYRFDRGSEAEVLQSDVGVANGLCFSPAGDTLYFADSLRRLIWAYDYDGQTGDIGPPRVLIDTAPLNSPPDGATVDADGDLWVALVGAAQVARFSPAGDLKTLIDTPIPFPSCPAFGGETLNQLFVTTISDSGGRLKTDHPDGGRTLVISGLGVTGLTEARCRL
jgi:sugar lactone lactonase YvrE